MTRRRLVAWLVVVGLGVGAAAGLAEGVRLRSGETLLPLAVRLPELRTGIPARAPGAPGLPARPAEDLLPVLLVPGWSDRADQLEPLRSRFLSGGWERDAVEAVGFRDPVGSNLEHAVELAAAAAELLERTGADRIDVVAHSMGGLAVRYWLHDLGGHDAVRRVVFLGTPHQGTVAAYLAWGKGGQEMAPRSPFLDSLNERGPVPPHVEALAVRTPVDLRVLPQENAVLPGVANQEVCCPTHVGLLTDPETFRLVMDFLTSR